MSDETKFDKLLRFFRLGFSLVLLPLTAGVMLTVFAGEFFPNRAKVSIQDNLFEYMYKGLSNNLFTDQYCKTAFNHFDRKSDGTLSKYGYIEILEDFVVYVGNKESKGNPALIDKIMGILNKAKETEPFASLPSEERRLMDNVQLFIQNNDSANSLNTLNELKQVILVRHKEYNRIAKQNAWSIPLAVLGILFTTIFGIWSIISAFRKPRFEVRKVYQ